MLATIAVVAALSQQPPSLLPEFPAKWGRLQAVDETREGKPIGRLAGTTDTEFTATGVALMPPPTDRELNFRVWLRSFGDAHAIQLNAFAYDKDGKTLMRRSTPVTLPPGDWKEGQATFCPPAGTVRMNVFVINLSKQPLDIASPTMVDKGPFVIALNGSGLLRASSGTVAQGGAGTITFPIPGPTAEQAPITFQITAEPASALKSYEIKRRVDDNWVCEAKVAPEKDGTVKVRWESLVLVRDVPPSAPPKTPLAPAPADKAAWLASTPVAQAEDAKVAAKAKELRDASQDFEGLARRIAEFTSRNKGTGEKFVSLDAASAMGCGGSCTSRANLAAALFRAAGVPARTVPHLPTWAYGSGLYEHWLTEYWHPGAGWIRIEPTQGEFMPRPSTFASLAISTIDDEQRTGKAGQRGWIMPGAAWGSGIQGSAGLMSVGNEDTLASNWCRPERRLDVTPELLAAAKAAWPPKAADTAPREKAAAEGVDALLKVLAK